MIDTKDRPFEPSRQPKTSRAKDIVSNVLGQIQSAEMHLGIRKRKRRLQDQETFEEAVSAIVCDLAHRHLTEPEGWVAITMSKKDLGKRSGRYGSPILKETLPKLLSTMARPEVAFIEIRKGQPGRQTTIKAGPRLINRIVSHGLITDDLDRGKAEEIIILRSPKDTRFSVTGKTKGKELDYVDTEDTAKYREELGAINAWLEMADLDYDYPGLSNAPDLTNRKLRRIFNNGGFDQGGRLYGGFWQGMSKNERVGILIGGKPTITLDYDQMNARLLYSLAGKAPPMADSYLVPGLERHRKGVKIMFNAMLNRDKKPFTHWPDESKQHFPDGISVKQVQSQILHAHPEVSHRFFTGIGLHLMFLESQIMIDILLALMSRGIVGLPIHDAVIVPRFKEAEAREIMLAMFKRHTGVTGSLSREEGDQNNTHPLLVKPFPDRPIDLPVGEDEEGGEHGFTLEDLSSSLVPQVNLQPPC